MRILYCQKMIFPNCSAHAIHTGITLANFAAAGGEVEFFPGSDKGGHIIEEHFRSLGFEGISGVKITGIPFRQRGLYGLFFRWNLWRAMRAGGMAICYATSVKEAHMALRLRKYAGIPSAKLPVVFEMHHMISLLKKGRQSERLRAQEVTVLREADMVVFTSEALRKLAAKLLPTPKFGIVSYIGYNENVIKPVRDLAADEPQADNGYVNLAYLGSLQPGKGVEELIQAVSFLPDDYRLTLIGGKPEKCLQKMRELAKMLAVEGRIDFTGQLPSSALSECLKNCDIFVIPIQTEADFFCPMKMHEALGFNLPIAATPNPSLKEVLVNGVNAIFSAGYGASELAEAIVKLGQNPVLRQTMRAENSALSAHYSSNGRARQLLSVMQGRFEAGRPIA